MELDVRGLRCPLPYIRAKAVLSTLDAAETLVVLADDPEAAIDLGALAADTGRGFAAERHRFTLSPSAAAEARPRCAG